MNVSVRPIKQVSAPTLTAYRPFIDGLRAVSILAVVLYHVGVPGISGGYVGVDIFFVISGFLIISQIVEGLRRGTFSFGGFWARRTLRIFPSYFLVLGCVAAIAPFLLVMPEEFSDFSRQVRDAAMMLINHLFLEQQGYFDTAADAKILLHFWSLAVEEQFYVVAPCVLAAAWWLPGWFRRPDLRPRVLLWTSVVVFAGSLLGCVLLTSGQNYAFYLAPLRAWEFVAGGAVGFLLPFVSRLPRGVLAWLSSAGLAAILFAVFFFDDDTLYPSWRASVPVFGAATLILAGIANPAAPVIRLLATRPMVWIGLISYSWYLWHWPLLAMARIHFGERDYATDLSMGALSLGLAAATYYFVERPIRRLRKNKPQIVSWKTTCVGVGLAIVVAIGGYQVFQGLSRHYRDLLASYSPTQEREAEVCDLVKGTGQDCLVLAGGKRIGLLIGDSQMQYGTNAIALDAEAAGAFTATITAPGCGAFFDVHFAWRNNETATLDCIKARQHPLDLLALAEIKPSYAVLYALWQIYGSRITLGMPNSEVPFEDQGKAYEESLRQTVADLQSVGIERILIVGPTPMFARKAPECLYRADRANEDRALECGLDRSSADEKQRTAVKQWIAQAIDGIADVRYIEAADDFCDSTRCLPYDGDKVLFADTNHPTELGMQRIIDRHRVDFDWVTGKSR